MNKSLILSALILFSFSAVARTFAQTEPTTEPQVAIPASGEDDNAVNALKNSTRHGEWVEIDLPDSKTKLKTFVVYPERPDKAPVVIVIHEIFGMSDWVRGVTDELAANGFIALAPDLLSGMGPNGGGTESMNGQTEIGQAIMKISRDEQAKRLDAVRDYALQIPSATDKSACIGFCWGGTASYSYAIHQPKLNAAVVYYGTPPVVNRAPDKDELAKIQCPILGCFGGNDARVTSLVEPTAQAMADLHKVFAAHEYTGAGHGFLRQHTGANGPANLNASKKAWPTTIAFLKENLEAK